MPAHAITVGGRTDRYFMRGWTKDIVNYIGKLDPTVRPCVNGLAEISANSYSSFYRESYRKYMDSSIIY